MGENWQEESSILVNAYHDYMIRHGDKKKPTPARATEPRQKTQATEAHRIPTPPPKDAPIGSMYKPWTELTEYEIYEIKKRMKKSRAWGPSDAKIRLELARRGRGWDNYLACKAEAEENGNVQGFEWYLGAGAEAQSRESRQLQGGE